MQFRRTTRTARRQARAVGRALAAVRDAALERPLPADRLASAARDALAAGADRLPVVRAAMVGAAMSNPDDPADFDHRERAYAVARQAVYGAEKWPPSPEPST